MNTISQLELEALFNQTAMGIITVDAQGSIVRVNQFALNQFGYERDELVGCKIEQLIPQRYKERHIQHRSAHQQAMPHHRPMGLGMDLWAMRKDGSEFPVEVSLSNYRTDTGQYSIAFISDITIRKASETALLKLNEELEEKVEERTRSLRKALEREQELGELKSRFVSMASHEFRTPLSTVLSSAYLISQYQQAEQQPQRDKHIQRIVSSVNMLTDILNDFLSVGRIEEGKVQVRPVPISIRGTMESVIGELELMLKPGQQLQYANSGGDEITLDPSLLKHIVQNLGSNAIKFSPQDAAIEIVTMLEDDVFVLFVKDKGIGIPREDQQHLFERFFRSANAVNIQGTGLGLHIVAKYAELMNGTVSFESEPELGTTFAVRFKIA